MSIEHGLLSVGAMLVLMAIAVPSMDGGTIESGNDDLATFTLPSGEECTDCVFPDEGCGGTTDRHTYGWDSGAGGDWLDDEGWHDCYVGSCEGHFHGRCSPVVWDLETMERLYAAVEILEGDQLTALLRRNSDHLVFNEDRQAIQVNGCNEQIAAHLPLRPLQLDALLD